MPKKTIHVTDEQLAAITRLHKLLDAQGIDVKDPKRPGAFSDSALFRYLVEQEIKRLTDNNDSN